MEFRKFQSGDLANLITDENLRAILLNVQVNPELTWTLVDKKTIACGGFAMLWPGVYEVWLYIDSPATFLNYKICLIKKFRQEINNLSYHRLQATVDVGILNREKFMNLLGFHEEGVLQNYSHEKHNHVMYARLG